MGVYSESHMDLETWINTHTWDWLVSCRGPGSCLITLLNMPSSRWGSQDLALGTMTALSFLEHLFKQWSFSIWHCEAIKICSGCTSEHLPSQTLRKRPSTAQSVLSWMLDLGRRRYRVSGLPWPGLLLLPCLKFLLFKEGCQVVSSHCPVV